MALHVDPNSSLGGCILTKRGGVSAGEAVASAVHPETSAHIAAVGGPALCPGVRYVCDMNKGRPPRRVPQGQRGARSPGGAPRNTVVEAGRRALRVAEGWRAAATPRPRSFNRLRLSSPWRESASKGRIA